MRRGGTYVVHRGLREIARRLRVSKDTAARYAASWGLPVFRLASRNRKRVTYFLPEPLAREWERRRIAETQTELRNGIGPNPLRYRRGRCPNCAVLLQRLRGGWVHEEMAKR